MFHNYAEYAKDIRKAIKSMPSSKTKNLRSATMASTSMIASALVTIAIAFTMINAGNKMSAIETVSTASVDPSVVEIIVNNNDIKSSQLASSKVANQSALNDETEEITTQAILEQLGYIDPSNATIRTDADGKTHLEFNTSNGAKVEVILNRNENGDFSIENVVANMTSDQLLDENKKDELDSERMSDQSNIEPYRKDIQQYSPDQILQYAGINIEDMNDADKISNILASTIQINDKVFFTIPNGFELESEEPISDTESEEQEQTENIDDTEEAEIITTYKNNNATLTIRKENIPESLKDFNGYVIANKMLKYWTDTVSSIAANSGQTLKNNTMSSEIFYMNGAEQWGYRANAVYTDGKRDITYNRIIVIDETNKKMCTISYRNDGDIDSTEGIQTYDTFISGMYLMPSDETAIGYSELNERTSSASKQS